MTAPAMTNWTIHPEIRLDTVTCITPWGWRGVGASAHRNRRVWGLPLACLAHPEPGVDGAQGCRRPPVAAVHQPHRRRHEQAAHDGCVNDDGEGHADPQL